MTKTERLERTRSIRRHLARFSDLQDAYLRQHLRDQGADPEVAALDHLENAQTELDELARLVRTEYAAGR